MPVVGCDMTRGKPRIVVWSKDEVATDQVRGERSWTLSQLGKCWNKRVEEENMVKPVSLGEPVTPAKNWNLVPIVASA